MKLHHAMSALQLLPSHREAAITRAEFIDKWRRAGQPELSRRQLERFLPDLEAESLAESVEGPGRTLRYFHPSSKTPPWAMTHETALRLLLSSRMLAQPLRGVGNEGAGVLDLAESVVSTSQASRRLHRRIRVVPDGIGRMPAQVAPGVQEAVVDAIASARQLRFVYRSRAAMETQTEGRTHEISVLGAVSKDGATYLLGAGSLTGRVLTFALHRILRAEVLAVPALERPDFDLDDYIAQTHQLSHVLGSLEVLDLQLRVRADAIWHLRERPLCPQQVISETPDEAGWYAVSARIPQTELLVPALLSMGDWLIVDGPPAVRAELARRLIEAAERYR